MMIPWLDFKIFGSGYGIGMPFYDGILYCVNGELYTFSHGLGAQLSSFQWKRPYPGESRHLLGRDFVVCNYSRRWGRTQIHWGLANPPRSLDDHHQMIRDLQADLQRLPLMPYDRPLTVSVREEEER